MREILDKGIEAVLPVYEKDKGNVSLVYTKEEEILMDYSIKTIIRRICGIYHYDIKSSNKYYGQLLSTKKHCPIPIHRDLILIQAKTRIPIGKHDGAYGYINIDAITHISSSDKIKDYSRVYLMSGKSIEVLCKVSTLSKSINNGHIIKKINSNKDDIIVRDSESRYTLDNMPATKKDIAMVYMKLEELKR